LAISDVAAQRQQTSS